MAASNKTATIISLAVGAVAGIIMGWAVSGGAAVKIFVGVMVFGVFAAVMRKSFRTSRRDEIDQKLNR